MMKKITLIALYLGFMVASQTCFADSDCEEKCNEAFDNCYNWSSDEDCVVKQTACLEKCGG